jgi:site-specific DNA-methyltransferase (adenine-specific)
VLDPFFGSGTVGVVCEQHYRNYVGIEINPEYVELALDRIKTSQRSFISLSNAAS